MRRTSELKTSVMQRLEWGWRLSDGGFRLGGKGFKERSGSVHSACRAISDGFSVGRRCWSDNDRGLRVERGGRWNLGCGSNAQVRVGPAAGERSWARSRSPRRMSQNFADARSFTNDERKSASPCARDIRRADGTTQYGAVLPGLLGCSIDSKARCNTAGTVRAVVMLLHITT